MNASSGQNLSAVRTAHVNAARTRVESCGALDECHGHGAVPPDERDMHLGRERPPKTGPRDRDRGVAEGVAHAPDASVTAADSRADCDTGGKSAARLTAVKLLIAKNIATSPH